MFDIKDLKNILGIFLALFFVFLLFFSAPSDFPLQEVITIEEGSSLNQVAEHLGENKVIRFPFIFKVFTFLSGRSDNIVAGDYLLYNDKNVLRIIEDLSTGDYGLSAISVTVPEGNTVAETAIILKSQLPSISESSFIFLAKNEEGRLFPDTYRFLPSVKEEQIIETMLSNFNQKVGEIEEEIKESGRSLDEIITMAAIIEEEARDPVGRRIISGILWERIKLGIPLQVDATFLYINGKNTYELTTEDLQTDHPYNTYTNKGLPPGPITNPGLDSILAALRPEKSNYLFYLSDRSGNLYYAEDLEGHRRNRTLYLNL